jgi:predicted RNase H-like nuclease (RuvC/YqgF family)
MPNRFLGWRIKMGCMTDYDAKHNPKDKDCMCIDCCYKNVQKEYNADLEKYTKEITHLKKDNFQKQREISRLNGLIESIYPFIMNFKDKIEKIEAKFKAQKSTTPKKAGHNTRLKKERVLDNK